MSVDTAPVTTPDLETGWRSTTPLDDTILWRGIVALAGAWEVTGRIGGGQIHRDERVSAVDLRRPTGFFNSAMLLRPLRDPELEVTVDQIEGFYEAAGQGAALLWSPWPTPDLAGRGWELQGYPPLLYRPAGIPVTRQRRDGLEVLEVTDPEALRAWCRLAVAAFPLEEVDRPDGLLDPSLLRDPRFRLTVAQVDGRAVAVGLQVIVNDTNVLLLGAARPEHRGHGHYATLVADRLAHRTDLPAVTIVSDDSRPILVEHFGFLPISRFTLWERPRP